jgi:hypothetical protein
VYFYICILSLALSKAKVKMFLILWEHLLPDKRDMRDGRDMRDRRRLYRKNRY